MTTLKQYGTEVGLTSDNFPDVMDPEFFEAWASYIGTQTAHELFNSAPQPEGHLRAVKGFLSSVSQFSGRPTIRPIRSPLRESEEQLTNYCKQYWKDINIWLTRIQFNQLLRLADVSVRLSSRKNPVANCLSYSADVYITYVQKPIRGKIPNIGQMLHAQESFWFKGALPSSVSKTDNLTKKLNKSAHGVSYDTYPRLPQLMVSARAWAQWNEDLGVDVARVHGNALCLRVQLPRLICFLMRKKQQEVEKLIVKRIKTIFV